MRVRVLAFATAASAIGSSDIEVELPPDSGLEALQRELSQSHPALRAIWTRLAIAVDGELAERDHLLHEGAEVALLPPVSGGRPERAWLTDDPIDIGPLLDAVLSPACGATVLFIGTVRRHHDDREVVRIHYEAYRPMAEAALEKIASDLEAGTEGLRVRLVHRLGDLEVGETSVAIAVASAHRATAYDASRAAVERIKREVPIWKHEHYADGETTWREEETLSRSHPIRESRG